jgi:hypothetical protein
MLGHWQIISHKKGKNNMCFKCGKVIHDTKQSEVKEKHFVFEIAETYDGYEFRSKHVTTAGHIDEVSNMSLEDYGHEDSGSDVSIEFIREIPKAEFDILVKYL